MMNLKTFSSISVSPDAYQKTLFSTYFQTVFCLYIKWSYPISYFESRCIVNSTINNNNNGHMEIDHTEDKLAPLTEDGILHQEELINAIEVWKIYKLLQRMKNK